MKDYDSRINRFISGGGPGSLVKGLIMIALAAGIYVFYAWSQFTGLKDADAMDYAQLGRSIAEGNGFTTRCIRPADTWYLGSRGKVEDTAAGISVDGLPDIRHAPLYPAVLSLLLKGVAEEGSGPARNEQFRYYAPELKAVVPIGIFFTLATGLLVYLFAGRLFGPLPAAAAAGAYLLADCVLSGSMSGGPLPMASFFFTGCCYAVLACSNCRMSGRVLCAWGLLLLASLLAAMAFLTMYSSVIVLAVVLPFILLESGSEIEEEGDEARWSAASRPVSSGYSWVAAGVFLFVFILTVMPWLIRNRIVGGGFLGLAPYAALRDTMLFPGDSFDRSLAPVMHNVKIATALRSRFFYGLADVYRNDLRTLGGGIVPCLFIVSFFKPGEAQRRRMRWSVLAGLGMGVILTALAGSGQNSAIGLLVPMVTVFAAGFMFDLIMDGDYLDLGLAHAMTWALIVLSALPAIFAVSGSRGDYPYPPYYPPHIEWVSGKTGEARLLCTDVPWASAWYAGKTSFYVPESLDDIRRMHSEGAPLGGLYLTPRTTGQSYSGALSERDGGAWRDLLNGVVPKGFPFTDGVFFPQGTREQLFLVERATAPGPPKEE